jgi:hypothetical protein
MREGLGLETRAGAVERGERLGVRGEEAETRRKRSAAASKARRRRMDFDAVEQEVRDRLIYQQVKAESRSQRSVARIWGISEARVSQIMRDMRRKVANNPDLFAITQRQEAQRQAEVDFLLRSEEDLAFVTMKMRTAAKPLVTRKVGRRGEVTYEETITREQKSEQLYWYRERRKVTTQIRDHASRPAAAPPPNSHLSPWHPWDCEAEEHASNWVQLVCQGILTRADYDVWCERHSHWCQLTYPSFNDMVIKMTERCPRMLWGLTPEKAMRMGTKVPGLERFADLAKAWVRDGGHLRDDWETPPAKEDDISPLPTWTLRTVDVSGKGSFVICDAEEAARAEAARGVGLGARGERGEVGSPAGGAAETTPVRGAKQGAARRSASDDKVASSRGVVRSGTERTTLRRSATERPRTETTASAEPLYPGAEADAQDSWGPEFEVNLSFNEQRRLLREAWDYLLEQKWVTPEEYADYLAREAREHGEDLTPAASAEGPEAFRDSVAAGEEVVQDTLPLAGGAEWGEGLEARGECGAPTQSGQPTASAAGGREEDAGRVEAGSGASAAAGARGAGDFGEPHFGEVESELSPKTPDPCPGGAASSRGAEQSVARISASEDKASSSRGAGCSGTEQTTLRRSATEENTLRRRDKPPRNRREQRFAERRERGRERRRQEEEARRAASERKNLSRSD